MSKSPAKQMVCYFNFHKATFSGVFTNHDIISNTYKYLQASFSSYAFVPVFQYLLKF